MLSENAKLLLEKCEPLLQKLMRYKTDGGKKGQKVKRGSSQIIQEVPFEVSKTCLLIDFLYLDYSCYIVKTPDGQGWT